MLRGIWDLDCSHKVGQTLSHYPRGAILSAVAPQVFTGSEHQSLMPSPATPGRSREELPGGAGRQVIWTMLVKCFESKCGSQAVLWRGLKHDYILPKRSLQGLRLLLCLEADF